MTDAAGMTINTLSAAARERLISAYFSKDKGQTKMQLDKFEFICVLSSLRVGKAINSTFKITLIHKINYSSKTLILWNNVVLSINLREFIKGLAIAFAVYQWQVATFLRTSKTNKIHINTNE